MPAAVTATLGSAAKSFEKSFFDLTKEKPICAYLKRLNKKQVVVAGCETDVCVLQSCLGLLDLGFDVFAVEELLFSSASRTDAAVERLKAAGVIFVSYKTLFELTEAVDDGPHADKMIARLGAFPDDIPEDAEHYSSPGPRCSAGNVFNKLAGAPRPGGPGPLEGSAGMPILNPRVMTLQRMKSVRSGSARHSISSSRSRDRSPSDPRH